MKQFAIDEDLEEILTRIGDTFGHSNIYETVLNSFLFLRFLEEIEKDNSSLFLQNSEGKITKLPISSLMNIQQRKEVEEKKTSDNKETKAEVKSKIIR